MLYVTHTCADPKCFTGFIDKDLTGTKNTPPSWKYCPSCVALKGKPDYQKPMDNPKVAARIQKAKAKGLGKHQFSTVSESPTSDLKPEEVSKEPP